MKLLTVGIFFCFALCRVTSYGSGGSRSGERYHGGSYDYMDPSPMNPKSKDHHQGINDYKKIDLHSPIVYKITWEASHLVAAYRHVDGIQPHVVYSKKGPYQKYYKIDFTAWSGRDYLKKCHMKYDSKHLNRWQEQGDFVEHCCWKKPILYEDQSYKA